MCRRIYGFSALCRNLIRNHEIFPLLVSDMKAGCSACCTMQQITKTVALLANKVTIHCSGLYSLGNKRIHFFCGKKMETLAAVNIGYDILYFNIHCRYGGSSNSGSPPSSQIGPFLYWNPWWHGQAERIIALAAVQGDGMLLSTVPKSMQLASFTDFWQMCLMVDMSWYINK